MADGIVHLVDDDAAVRRSLGFLLMASGFAVRVYGSGAELLAALAAAPAGVSSGFQSGCVVTDVRMPEMDGLELLRRLRRGPHHLPVVVMTGHGDVPLAVEAMKAGAADFLEKPFDDESFLVAIRLALDRQEHGARRNEEAAAVAARFASLSAREREVLLGLVAGRPNKTIAYDLCISPRTVEAHRANVMAKMGAASLPELVRMALLAEANGGAG